jgi:hypothetical protein
MVTNAQGNSYTIAGSELNKRNKIIMASNTTVTGAPLKAGGSVRIYFSADITANDGNTVMQINYNGVNYYVKAPKDGGLINFVAHAVGNVYKYVQAYTTLEMLFDGNQFVIIGNPVVISNSDYVINADGSITYSAKYINDNTFWNKCTIHFDSIPADFTTARNAYNSYVVKMLIVGNNHLMEEVQFSFSRNNETGAITTSNCYNLSGLASQAIIRNENGVMVCTINTPTYGTAEVFYHKIY